MTIKRTGLAAFYLTLASTVAPIPEAAFAQEAEGVNAYAPIHTAGYFVETSAEQSSFTGLATGTIFFETDAGVMNSGNLSCSISMEISAPTTDLETTGKCKVLGTQGKVLFGRYECKGTLGLGCNGRFSVTGGSDEFEGATGDGDFLLRTLIAESILSPNSTLSSGNNGIAVWRDLKVNLIAPVQPQEENEEPDSEGER